MKLLISYVSAFFFIFAMMAMFNTAMAGCNTHHKHYKSHKHCTCYTHKHHHRHYVSYRTTTYYVPGYCVSNSCACGGRVCYPGYYYQCRTEYSYHSGRNSARVEVCQ